MLDMDVSSAARVIVACCILHNYLLDYNDEWLYVVPAPPAGLAAALVPQARVAAQRRAQAHGVRNSLLNQLRNNPLQMV